MPESERRSQERTAVNRRLRRGVCECMTCVPMGGDMYSVTSSSGREYHVDAAEGRCSCPDAKHNIGPEECCKHEFRVRVLRQEKVIPAAIDRDDLDPLLGTAMPVATALCADAAQVKQAADGGERPDDCNCPHADHGLPCFQCYLAGFRSPADGGSD